MPAEFEKNEGILVRWPYQADMDITIAELVKHVSSEGKTWILFDASNVSCDTLCIKNFLENQGALYDSLFFLQIPSETGRIRDYGPITGYMYNSSVYERFFYDPGYSLYSQPLNDSVPQLLSDLTGIPVNDLFINLEGGNIQFDGLKTGFGSQRLLEQNPSFNETTLCNLLKSYFRLDEFILLPIPENIGGADWHRTDMFMKVLDTETLLISEYPDWVPDYGIIEGIADSLGLLMNGFGKPYNIIRIPAPVLADGTYANEPTDEVRSYTNALILNRKVIIPSYGTLSDSIAKAIYQEAMPGYEIVMVDSRSLSGSYGAIHTYTCQLPQSELLRFQHYRINGEQEFQPEMPISCYPQTNSMIDSLLVHYRVHPSQSFSTSRMFPACPGFIGTIPDLSPGDTVSYYLSMHTPVNQVTEPLPAPGAVYTFWFPAIQTDIRESFETNQTMKLYPNPNHGSFICELATNPIPGKTFELIDVDGNKSLIINIQDKKTLIQVPSELKNGVYLGRILTSDAPLVNRIILQR